MASQGKEKTPYRQVRDQLRGFYPPGEKVFAEPQISLARKLSYQALRERYGLQTPLSENRISRRAHFLSHYKNDVNGNGVLVSSNKEARLAALRLYDGALAAFISLSSLQNPVYTIVGSLSGYQRSPRLGIAMVGIPFEEAANIHAHLTYPNVTSPLLPSDVDIGVTPWLPQTANLTQAVYDEFGVFLQPMNVYPGRFDMNKVLSYSDYKNQGGFVAIHS